jgi:hypothetical protein
MEVPGTMSLTVSRSRTIFNSVPLLFCLQLAITAFPSQRSQNPSTIEDDAERIIREYTSPQAIAQMRQWKELTINVDQPTRLAILSNLPATYRKYQNNNKILNAKLNAIIDRSLAAYNKHYSLLILTHPEPAVMHENYTVLVITTELLKRIPNDAALKMFLFHETAHDFFAEESIRLKKQLRDLVINKRGNGPEAEQLVRQLILIELKCDAVATRFAILDGQDTASFADVLLNIYKDYPHQLNAPSYLGFNTHPSPPLRAHVIQSIDATRQRSPTGPNQSPELKEIKAILGTNC